jgi:hypothetical protein
MAKIEIEMMKALIAYSGPVKLCRPGKARGVDLPRKDDRTQRWLDRHSKDARSQDKHTDRRMRRMERAQRERIEKLNAMVRKRNGLDQS